MRPTKISREQQRKILAALRDAGIIVSDVYDLVNSPNRNAVPVLLKFLAEPLDSNTKEGIVRAVTLRKARSDVLGPLITEFKNPSLSHSVRWAIGNALEVVADDSRARDLIELATERKYGTARQMIVLGLAKLKDADSIRALLELLNDPEVEGHAIIALGKRRATHATPLIERFLGHPNTWIRREAKKALARIARSERHGAGGQEGQC